MKGVTIPALLFGVQVGKGGVRRGLLQGMEVTAWFLQGYVQPQNVSFAPTWFPLAVAQPGAGSHPCKPKPCHDVGSGHAVLQSMIVHLPWEKRGPKLPMGLCSSAPSILSIPSTPSVPSVSSILLIHSSHPPHSPHPSPPTHSPIHPIHPVCHQAPQRCPFCHPLSALAFPWRPDSHIAPIIPWQSNVPGVGRAGRCHPEIHRGKMGMGTKTGTGMVRGSVS